MHAYETGYVDLSMMYSKALSTETVKEHDVEHGRYAQNQKHFVCNELARQYWANAKTSASNLRALSPKFEAV